PADADVVTEEDLRTYADALTRNGFFAPNSYYMNHEANGRYAGRAVNDGVLDMPVLFLAARYDYTCESTTSPLAGPMAEHCRRLTSRTLNTGHWMAQERSAEVNAALVE